jgi:VCBS repeat-containing protein
VAPVAVGDQAALGEDSAVVIKVLGNDTDADGDPLRVAAVTQGQHGKVTINADGTLAYAPAADFFGTDSFTYTISDGRGGTSTATVSLVVRPVNDAPAATDDAAHTAQGQPVTLNVLANDTDVDGDALQVTAVGQGTHGKVGINADGTLTYYPASGFAGTDTFTYTVSDGSGGSASGTVSVQVDRANAPPTASNGLAAMETGTPISGTLTVADADNAPGELRFGLATGPAHGTVNVQADGTYTYTPVAGYAGSDSFTFTVTDPSGASDSATVSVTVLANDIDPGSGREIAVNTTTVAGQQAPAMAALSGGGFVVAWESQNQDGSSVGIFAQRFDAAGQAVGAEFQVNTYTQNGQAAPTVAALSGGGFVIAWDSQNQDGSNKGIFAQRYDANGQAVDAEFQVNTFTQNAQEAADVAALADGGFVVTWQSQNQDGNGVGIFAQRFDSAGQAAGAEFQVNSFTQGAQSAPAVSALSTGGFVIAWESQNQGRNHPEIYVQRYGANGQAIGGEIRANTDTRNDLHTADVTELAGGGFVVVWQSQNQDGSGLGIFGQMFAANGSRLGGEFQVNTETQRGQQTATVTDTADGGFVVVWESDSQDGSSFGVFGQRFDANGVTIGQEFQINTYTSGFQGVPDATILADGSLAVSWQSAGQDGNANGVFARIFDASVSTGHAFVGSPGNDSFIGGAQADKASGGGGDDILIGGAGDDVLDGGAGNDQLEGSLGVDQLFGGSGDDILLWDSSDAVIDGGAGRDTLEIGSGDVDLTAFPNKIGGLEVIDLASDGAANHLILNAQDILDISDTDVLAVLGDGLDSVDAGSGWTQAGNDGQGNDIYTQSIGGAIATLIVDSDILLNGDILI